MKQQIFILALSFISVFSLAAQVNTITIDNSTAKKSDQAIAHSDLYGKGSFTLGIQVANQIFQKSSPVGVQLQGGWERSWIEQGSIYLAVEPRLKVGYIHGSSDDDGILSEMLTRSVNYNTYLWGASGLGRIGYLLKDRTTAIYIDGEVGLNNFHTRANIGQYKEETLHHWQNEFAKFYMGANIGVTGKLPTNNRASLWIGVSTVNTNMFLDGMELEEPSIMNRKLNGQIGLAIFF